MKFSLYILGLVLLGSSVFADNNKLRPGVVSAADIEAFSAKLCAQGKTQYCRITATTVKPLTAVLTKPESKALNTQPKEAEVKDALEALEDNSVAEKQLEEDENELEESSGARARHSRRNRKVRRIRRLRRPNRKAIRKRRQRRNRQIRRNRKIRRMRKIRRLRKMQHNRKVRRNRRIRRARRAQRARRNRRRGVRRVTRRHRHRKNVG